MKKLHVKKGDKVKVLSGEQKGEIGKIIEMLPSQGKARVEGIRVIKKHEKPSASSPEGGIREMEAPIHVDKLMLIDPKSDKPTRVGRKRNDEGKLVRYSKKTQEIID
mgnify:CR=1 FL=1